MRFSEQFSFFSLSVCLLVSSCGVKTPVISPLPETRLVAKEASPQQLIDRVNNHFASVTALKVERMEVSFVEEQVEGERLVQDVYREANGYLLAQDPQRIRVNILNPLTSSSLISMASTEGRFQVFIPRENKLLHGENSVRVKGERPMHRVRPQHLLRAVLIEPIETESASLGITLREEEDALFNYYVLALARIEGGPIQCLEREVWIERSQFMLRRQIYFDCGQIQSIIDYSDSGETQDGWISSNLRLRRPREGYELGLKFETESLVVNQPVDPKLFRLPIPPAAEVQEVTGSSNF